MVFQRRRRNKLLGADLQQTAFAQRCKVWAARAGGLCGKVKREHMGLRESVLWGIYGIRFIESEARMDRQIKIGHLHPR